MPTTSTFFSKAMPFKNNFLKKIEIDRLAENVLGSIGTVDSGLRIDREAMRRLIETGPFQYEKKRDLDLYILPTDGGENDILVLDNELKIYRTTIADVAMRKSPTLKEMISIRNAIRILNDSDVVISRKQDTVSRIQDMSVSRLDLSWSDSDIDALAYEGAAALESRDQAIVQETLTLFAELLGYKPLPKNLQKIADSVIGQTSRSPGSNIKYGPVVVYHAGGSELLFFDCAVSAAEAEKKFISGEMDPDIKGLDVFHHLKKMVLEIMQ
jgi:hypothetical protein